MLISKRYSLEQAFLGLVQGVTPVLLIGKNGAVTTTYETIWDNSNQYTFLNSALAQSIVSSSANDAAAGTGARTISISGLDGSFNVVTETITLNGATPVALVNTYCIINSIVVLTAGSGGVAAGNLTLSSTGPVTNGYLLAGLNQSTSFIYGVPTSHKLLMYDLRIASRSTTAGGHEAAIFYKENFGLQMIKELPSFTNAAPHLPNQFIPTIFNEKTQFKIDVLASAGTGPVVAMARCLLVDTVNSTFLGL